VRACVVRGSVDGPGVISDWQCCVDRLLAKYCRCRLRLDWCWCRWRNKSESCCWVGLHVWRRQVGLVRGTRWPAGSSASDMVARTTRRSRGRFLGWASKPRSSRDYMGSESWVVIGGGYIEFAGFAVVHQKTSGILSWSTKPRPKTLWGGAATQAGSTAQEGRSDRPGVTPQVFKLASLMLMPKSTESNLLTLVRPWSTWVITSKTESTSSNDPLDQVNNHLWSTLGRNPSQNPFAFEPLQNFCCVLQISPKHFKIP
jgi:hypothetical protein